MAVGATEGVVVIGIPYLLYLGQRHGVYGRIGDAYMNANRTVYNFVNTRVVAHYGPTWGRIAGAGSVVGSNITTGGALYGLGRIANLW